MLGVNFYFGNIIGIEVEIGYVFILVYDCNEWFDFFVVDLMGWGVCCVG